MTTHVSHFLAAAIASALVFAVSHAAADEKKASDEYPEFYNGDSTKGIDFVQSIRVLAPRYCSNVKGDVTVVFEAPGMTRAITRCWRPGGEWGADAVLADILLGSDGRGEFVFHADDFPNGPLTVRIQAIDGKGHQDYCELQLFNLGGVVWRQGAPKEAPPAASGLKLVYLDDFDGPLSISPDGRGARYAAHKTGGGDFSGWPFSDQEGDCLPFGQQGTWLRIHASKPYGTKGRAGILSSIRPDGSGIAVPVPAYFECRLMCHSAPGSWGAFWTLTQGTIGMDKGDPKFAETKAAGVDELDILECYGGYGPKNPNAGGHYGITSHFWNQKDDPRLEWSRKKLADGKDNPGYIPNHLWADAMTVGGKSSWSWTFHTYGLLITETDTVYYLDNVEMLRHPTGPVTKSQNTWFLINYAISGISGWPYDLERYGNESDMWVDWVRVYCGKPLPADFGTIPPVGVEGTIGVNFTAKGKDNATMREWDIAGEAKTCQRGWNNVSVSDKESGPLSDSAGKPTTATVAIGGKPRYIACEPWGMTGADERLHRGGFADAKINVRDIPFGKYDLIVHLGADANWWNGDVILEKPDGTEIDARGAFFGWIGGNRYVEAVEAKGVKSAEPNCYAVFRGFAEKDVSLSCIRKGGVGNAAIVGVQIVPSK